MDSEPSMSPAPVVVSAERARTDQWILAVFAGSALLISLLVAPESLPHIGLCWFREFTGIPCAGCGLTHAFCAVGHGQLSAAMRYNPMVLMMYPLFVIAVLRPFVPRRADFRREQWERAGRIFWLSAGILFILLGVYRVAVFPA